jgi:hypothetical protein
MMSLRRLWIRFRATFRAYPLVGLVFLFSAFLVTVAWFIDIVWLDGVVLPHVPKGREWFDPLAGILSGLGVFLIAAILIFRKIDTARTEADAYGLTRGLAIGYYFNFVRPLIEGIRDPKSSLHSRAAAHGAIKIAGLIVGMPQSMTDCDPADFNEKFDELRNTMGVPLEIHEVKIEVAGRPRPVVARLAVNLASMKGVFVDIPTTLTVIPEFADFVSKTGHGAMIDDENIRMARAEVTAMTEIDRFRSAIEEFERTILEVGIRQPRGHSPTPHLHFAALPRLRHRVIELIDQ